MLPTLPGACQHPRDPSPASLLAMSTAMMSWLGGQQATPGGFTRHLPGLWGLQCWSDQASLETSQEAQKGPPKAVARCLECPGHLELPQVSVLLWNVGTRHRNTQHLC